VFAAPTPRPSTTIRASQASRAAAEAMTALNPDFAAIHYEAPDGPTECVAVLSQAFHSLLWSVLGNLPSYTGWLLDTDPHPAYALPPPRSPRFCSHVHRVDGP